MWGIITVQNPNNSTQKAFPVLPTQHNNYVCHLKSELWSSL